MSINIWLSYIMLILFDLFFNFVLIRIQRKSKYCILQSHLTYIFLPPIFFHYNLFVEEISSFILEFLPVWILLNAFPWCHILPVPLSPIIPVNWQLELEVSSDSGSVLCLFGGIFATYTVQILLCMAICILTNKLFLSIIINKIDLCREEKASECRRKTVAYIRINWEELFKQIAFLFSSYEIRPGTYVNDKLPGDADTAILRITLHKPLL